MKILDKITIKNLKLNQKRTIVTIIGVILSVALICAIGGMFSCLRATLLENAISDNGYYHISVSGDLNTKTKLENNRDIEKTMNIYQIGYSVLEGSQNEYKPYLKLMSIEDPNDFLNLPFNLIEGRYPANSDEVVISESIISNGKVNYEVGDTITLNIGDRFACGNKVLSTNYLPYELMYNDNEEVVCESEELHVLETREVKVVGIIERLNYQIESYDDAGYTILTTSLESDTVTTYAILKNPRNYEDALKKLENLALPDDAIQLNNEVLRWEVFKFSDGTTNMLLAIISVLIFIIMVTSIFCIRNSFAISTMEKTKMFGMLSSVGATKKQIKKCVLKEAGIVGLIGIPLGILSGILADYILIIVMNSLLGDFVLGSNFVFKIAILPIFFSIILGILTIYLSAITSARRASRISPISAIRNVDDIKIESKNLKTPWFISKFFKTGGVIAYKNLKRSKKKYRTTVVSLVVSIFAFITMNSFINYAISLSGSYYTDYKYDVAVYLNKDVDYNMILSLNDVDDYTLIYQTTYLKVNDLSKLSSFAYDNFIKNADCLEDVCKDSEYIDLGIKVLDDYSFKKYIESLNLNYEELKDKAVLSDNYLLYTDTGRIYKRLYEYRVGETITGLLEDVSYSFPIGAVVNENPTGLESTYYYGGYLFVNEKYYDFLETSAEMLALNSKNPDKLEEEIHKLNLDLNVNNISQRRQEEKSMLILYSIFLYGFITVITLIGVTNIFNTITANMALRQKEFMVLKSIGMTKREFNRMINLETIFYSFKALFYGIILGIVGSFFVYKAFAVDYDSGFSLPYKAIVISIIFVLLLVFVIMRYSIKKINKQNIIETIRNENV